jgi:hypothetical protein
MPRSDRYQQRLPFRGNEQRDSVHCAVLCRSLLTGFRQWDKNASPRSFRKGERSLWPAPEASADQSDFLDPAPRFSWRRGRSRSISSPFAGRNLHLVAPRKWGSAAISPIFSCQSETYNAPDCTLAARLRQVAAGLAFALYPRKAPAGKLRFAKILFMRRRGFGEEGKSPLAGNTHQRTRVGPGGAVIGSAGGNCD